MTVSSHISEKSHDVDLRLIATESFCVFDLLLYVPVNCFGHVETLTVERDIKQLIKQAL